MQVQFKQLKSGGTMEVICEDAESYLRRRVADLTAAAEQLGRAGKGAHRWRQVKCCLRCARWLRQGPWRWKPRVRPE
jgi:hypothetical protein